MSDPAAARAKVLERYPLAYCEESGRGLYVIVSTPYRGYVIVSDGEGQSSVAESWLSAARRIERQDRIQEQGEQP